MIVAMSLWPHLSARDGPLLDRSFGRRDQALAIMLGLSLLLSACGRAVKAPDMPRAPVGLQERFYAPRGWTWSALPVAGCAWRYGVASPPMVPKGSVLILAGSEDPAEVWFETANDLIGKGYTVWLLDVGVCGQTALDPEAASRMISAVIRPKPHAGLVIVGDGLGAALALNALAAGKITSVRGMVLASPVLDAPRLDLNLSDDQSAAVVLWTHRLHLGWLPLPGDGQAHPRKPADANLDPQRARLASAWRRSDPALRVHRTTFGWLWSASQQIEHARHPRVSTADEVPTVMLAEPGDERAKAACRALPACTYLPSPAISPHLGRDEARGPWLNHILVLLGAGGSGP